ncbi:MAG: ABC transporter ATP-binding protein [Lachnospiraceae bacterium]|nr:ABC transporter ATP-binding protein [Lachnospiraceae bacterium]MDE6980602.1 ABC transporter ATP-binding protein [Lachnospiraceae bacterium]
MEILRVEDLCKTYGAGETRVEAVKNVSFSMSRGEFGTVVGVSGSGKSTLLHCIGGLDTADGGKVFLNGRDIFHMKENERTIFRRRNVGFIFQSFHLVQELTVEQNIIFPLLLDYRKPEKASVEEMLEVLGLENRRHHLPGQLSGGQQQRTAIGRALITKPSIVLADEPTGNLDSKSSQDVMDLLLGASKHFKQTVLMITHNMNLTTSADRVFRVADGKLEELGGGQE